MRSLSSIGSEGGTTFAVAVVCDGVCPVVVALKRTVGGGIIGRSGKDGGSVGTAVGCPTGTCEGGIWCETGMTSGLAVVVGIFAELSHSYIIIVQIWNKVVLYFTGL